MKYRTVLKNFFSFLAILVSLFLFSCTSSRDKMAGGIAKMESEIETAQIVDSNAVIELLGAYQNFSLKYPDDSLAPEYLFKAAGLALDFNHGEQAIDLYESIIHTYPDYKKAPECFFMEAFTYENTLKNIGKANDYYNEFLIRYPNHELADDARTAIKYLGKSPDEMVREWEKTNTDSIK